ncbi:MAG: ABC transporter ATP-binding protein, partial [Brachybacterium sp.]
MTDLSLRGLTWQPYTRAEPTVLDLDLEIPAGQRVLLAGASGSGKSTVLRALAGLLDEETGELTGSAPGPARPGERGLLLQNPLDALVAATVGREAAFGPENAALPRAEIQARTTAALDAALVDLPSDRAPLDASGGQQQRLALAGSLALDPSALLLDEPTSMLDEATAAAVRESILATAAGRTL